MSKLLLLEDDLSLVTGLSFIFCEKMRQVSKVLIMFLTASNEEMNVIMGLNLS